jgi:hypothetical protein
MTTIALRGIVAWGFENLTRFENNLIINVVNLAGCANANDFQITLTL